MSVVAVKITNKEITIGADSFLSFSHDTQLKDKDAKLFEVNGLIVGCVGWAQDAAFFRVFCKSHNLLRDDEEAVLEFLVEYVDWARKKDQNYVLSSTFMIIVKERVYQVSPTFWIKEVKDIASMGAGMNMAQTALVLGKSVKEAIQVACTLSIYCEEPINLITRKLQ